MARMRKPLVDGDEIWIVGKGTINEMRDEPFCRNKTTAKQHVLAFLRTWASWAERAGDSAYLKLQDEVVHADALEDLNGYSYSLFIGDADHGTTIAITARKEVYRGGRS